MVPHLKCLLLAVVLLLPLAPLRAADKKVEAAPGPSVPLAAEVEDLVVGQNVDGLRAKGEKILPILVDLYHRSDEVGRANLAWIFYQLSWKSEAAKEAMMADIHTPDKDLRLQVQWALGRVSNDDAVVDALLDNLENDRNPLFRDKAACGIASDQIHLTEKQKVRLYRRLIALLDSESPQTRDLAIRVLEVHTGQRKGFSAGAPWVARVVPVAAWNLWINEYERNVS